MARWRLLTISGAMFVSLAALFLARQPCTAWAPSLSERTIDLVYSFTLRDIPTDARQIAAWVPVPPSNGRQHLVNLSGDADWPSTVVIEPEYGNRFIRFDLSGAAPEQVTDIAITVTFRVERKSYRLPDTPRDGEPPSEETLARFLAPDLLIPVNGKIAQEAWRVAGEAEGPLARARRLYDHIVTSVTYDKSGEGWGRGDAIYACDVRRGNCTDFHSLFIGEARALGIPARFIMGVPVPEGSSEGEIKGYHCWAEFYVEDHGWIPVDASEASKFPEKKEAFFGGLDANRIEFTVGRDIRLPGASVPPLNYVIYPHVEVDGQPYDNVETRFTFRE